jgi:hypothetical protein
VTPDVVFWREREDEFRKHDTGYSAVLAGSWSSFGGTWRFQPRESAHPSFGESVQLFKSLAREAAKGLGSKRGAESWIDWLDLLRCAKDNGTGEILYAQVTSSFFVAGERERDRMSRDGEALPAGALIEFMIGADGLGRRLCWDTTSAKIEHLFRNSANLCLELRSLAGHTASDAEETPREGRAARPIPLSQFWKDRQVEFAKYVDRFGDLSAHWRAAFGKWILSWGSTPIAGPISHDGQNIFKTIAMKAITELSSVTAGGDAEPWQVWLSTIREQRQGLRITHKHPVTEREWEAGVKFGRPLLAVWRELGLPTGDEEAEASRWLEDGSIDHVFQTSADFCEVLLARVFEMEVMANTGIERPSAAPESGDSGSFPEPKADVSGGTTPSSTRPGPKTDFKTASRVDEIVKRVAPEGDWGSDIDDIAAELDDEKIPHPKTWPMRDPPIRNWTDAATTNRDLAKKAIAHHLKIARG